MKLYSEGKWLPVDYESLGLTKRDHEIQSTEDYLKENGFYFKPFLHKGEDNEWEIIIHAHDSKEIYFAYAIYGDGHWNEFFIENPHSFMLFWKEWKEFFKEVVEEWVECADGSWLRQSEIINLWYKDLKPNGDTPSEFHCQTKDGQTHQLETVYHNGFYMRQHFGIRYYKDHTRLND